MMRGLANVGDVLAGKYRVDKILGIGGMGMVVAATHLEIGQQVALKFMLPAAMRSPESSERFLREARAAGKLTSEHICRVTDVGRFESGAPYIVMEYLEGYDLGTMLKHRGPLRIAAAVDYILQACEGLAEAHAQGIVHRDLKPDNLYLAARSDGGHIIKVLDFGISKVAATGIATATGDILGSPAYMSPEQMRSTKDVDARADVWSLGSVMYQLLTGRLPFAGDSLPTLCMSVLNDEPVPPNEIRHDLPEGLSETILRCLAKEPDDRFADVGELAAALGPFATPNGFGSVTRVRSALKGRQAPLRPSQTFPRGFTADDSAAPELAAPVPVPPTLVGTGSDLFAPRPGASKPTPLPTQAADVTTLGASAGESIDMVMTTHQTRSRGGFPIGLVGGLCGAIGLVVVLIVMVLRSSGGGGGDGDGDGAMPEVTQPPRAAAQSQDVPRPPPPKVTPIDEPAGDEPAGDEPAGDEPAGAEPTAAEPTAAKAPEGRPGPQATRPDRGARPTGPRGKRPPKRGAGKPAGGKPPAEPDDDVTVEDDPSPPPPDLGDDEEDVWGRMHHDQPKAKTP